MVAVIGRRRVGKTFLVRQTYAKQIAFDLTGLQTGSMNTQLQAFQLSFARTFPKWEGELAPKNWLEAFDRLARAVEKLESLEKPVVFLDELPWLATARSGFIEALGWFWNSWAVQRRVVVVICGSAASWMINKVINDRGGLHNRVTKMIHLEPFTLRETELFCQARNLRFPQYQLLQLYMIMGGIPMYLDQLRPGLSVTENVQNICFARDGFLRREFDRLFASLFSNYERHVAIVRTLAKKRIGLTRMALVEALNTNGGSLTRTLNELMESGFLTVYQGYKKKRRDELYRLTDNYSLFYLTYLEKQGKSNAVEFTHLSGLPSWRAWSGYAFENICLTHVKAIKVALGISGLSTKTSSLYVRGGAETAGAQIDLLIERNDATVHLCEAKFTQAPLKLNSKLAKEMETKAAVFTHVSKANDHVLRTLLTIFPPEGDPGRYGIDRVVTMEDLFR